MDKATFEKYYRYMESVSPRLREAEKIISDIKSTEEWKRAYNYFHVLYNRGYLKENPSSKNGYKIITGGRFVSIADIKDILTAEQLEQIEKRSF